MTSESQSIRNVLNLLEDINAGEPNVLNEGWVDRLKGKLFGDKDPRSLGTKERQQLANLLYKEWQTWLGQTDREGALDDMIRFMSHRIGFKDEDIDAVIQRTNVLPETPEGEKAATKKDSKKTEPESSDEDIEDEDEEDGKPIPTDLNTKLSDYGKVGKATNESEISDADIMLSDDQVKDIMDAAAAIINDEYLYNGPENDKAELAAQAMTMVGGASKGPRGRPISARSEDDIKHSAPKGYYDSDQANDILDQWGITKGIRGNLMKKAKSADTLDAFSKRDKENLFLIGLAILRSRT